MTTKNYKKTDKSINSQPEMSKSGNKKKTTTRIYNQKRSLSDIDMTVNRRKRIFINGNPENTMQRNNCTKAKISRIQQNNKCQTM